MFAVSSIPMALKYYKEFQRQIAESHRQFTIATIFSYAANEDDPEDVLQEEDFDAIVLFGDKNANGIVLLKSFDDYWNGYEDNDDKYHPGYVDLLEKLETEEAEENLLCE